jgi:glycosyltransferase involved in cell wall biosynthesis
MKTDVIYLTNAFPQQRVLKWVNSLNELGYNVYVFSCRKEQKKVSTFDNKMNFEVFGKGNFFDFNPYSYHRLRKLYRLIDKNNIEPKLIIVRDLFQSYIGYKLSKKYNAQLIIDVADNYPEVFKAITKNKLINSVLYYFFNYVEKKALFRANIITTVSMHSKNLLIKKHRINQEKIIPIRNIPLKIYNKDLPICKKDNNKIVYIGSYNENIRDLKTICRTIVRLYQELGVKLDIFTFDKARVKNTLESELGKDYKKYINVQDTVSNRDLFRVLSEYSMGLIPHFRSIATDYTEPNKLYDYIYSNIPVLSSDNPTLVDSIYRYRIGETYSPGDTESLYNAVIKILKNRELYVNNIKKIKGTLYWENDFRHLSDEIEKFML